MSNWWQEVMSYGGPFLAHVVMYWTLAYYFIDLHQMLLMIDNTVYLVDGMDTMYCD